MLNVHVTAGHRPTQPQKEPAGWEALFPFLSGLTEFFCKVESKFLKSRVLTGGFVMECAKKVVEKSAA